MKKCVILRGVPGSGKSTVAQKLLEECWDIQVQIPGTTGDEYMTSARGVICSADDYFKTTDGVYNFNAKLLKNAHEYCRSKVETCMQNIAGLVGGQMAYDVIVVDNTNTRHWEYQPYVELAEKYGYEVEIKVVGEFDKESVLKYAQRNTHGVPVDKVIAMAERFEH